MALKWIFWTPLLGSVALARDSFSFLPAGRAGGPTTARRASADAQALENALDALQVMQSEYFAHWLGTWPEAIDWTAAVLGSHVAGALSSLSHMAGDTPYAQSRENMVALYFSETVGAYFGQDAFTIRGEAYDDMLWVVLQWVDAITFVDKHSELHYSSASAGLPINQSWHGNVWTPAFAHRARIFWELASEGWDTTMCGGGMLWNPRLEPYKNAITNELFIAASIAMYLHFPGDSNHAPFNRDAVGGATAEKKPHDPAFLRAAVDGYRWLSASGMMNRQGLYVDGFHVSGRNSSPPHPKCDLRSEMVFTYNQGVILTGQIGLWQVSSSPSFLQDGHKLIQSVIAATGYNLDDDRPIDDVLRLRPGQFPPWRGLGRAGVMEEICDITGTCSQDSQTFKGIFFHHLTAFCAPLAVIPGVTPAMDPARLEEIREAHSAACRGYVGWLRHNAMAALLTRDNKGRFGMWWTAGLLAWTTAPIPRNASPFPPGVESFDYRTFGVPDDELWVGSSPTPDSTRRAKTQDGIYQQPMGDSARPASQPTRQDKPGAKDWDPNDRGRGRTVETQGGGLAVLRALSELSRIGTE